VTTFRTFLGQNAQVTVTAKKGGEIKWLIVVAGVLLGAVVLVVVVALQAAFASVIGSNNVPMP